MVGVPLRHRGAELLGQRAACGPTSPTARRWGSAAATRGRIGCPAPLHARRPRGRHRPGGDPAAPSTPRAADARPARAAAGWQVERPRATRTPGPLAPASTSPPRVAMAAFPFATSCARGDPRGPSSPLVTRSAPRRRGQCRSPSAATPTCASPAWRGSDWDAEIPVREQLRLDAAMLPPASASSLRRGRAARARARSTTPMPRRPPALRSPSRAAAGASSSRSSPVPVRAGLRPAEDDVVAFEPMTAPTTRWSMPAPSCLCRPGESYRAGFWITLADGDQHSLGHDVAATINSIATLMADQPRRCLADHQRRRDAE